MPSKVKSIIPQKVKDAENDRLNLFATLEAIDKVFEYTSGVSSVDEFYNDSKTFDAVLLNFVTIGEMAGRLTHNFMDTHTTVDWYDIRGFRHRIAHDYLGIDADEAWEVVTKHLPGIRKEIKRILGYEDTKVVVEKAGTDKTVVITVPTEFDKEYKVQRKAELKKSFGAWKNKKVKLATDRFEGEAGKRFLDGLRSQSVATE